VKSVHYRREEEEYLIRGGMQKKHGCWREMGGKNVKTPHILECEKNGPDSKCAFEQNNFVSIRYVAFWP
jgi:hypothetical protein